MTETKIFKNQENSTKFSEFNITGETIRRGEIQIEHAHLTKLNKELCLRYRNHTFVFPRVNLIL